MLQNVKTAEKRARSKFLADSKAFFAEVSDTPDTVLTAT